MNGMPSCVASAWEPADFSPRCQWDSPWASPGLREADPQLTQQIERAEATTRGLVTVFFEADEANEAVCDAVRDRLPDAEAFRRLLDALDRVLDLMQQLQDHSEELAWQLSQGPGRPEAEDALEWITGILDAGAMLLAAHAVVIGLSASRTMGNGRESDSNALLDALGLPPTGRELGGLGRVDYRMGLFKVSAALLRGVQSYMEKPRRYYTSAVANEAVRDLNQLRIQDSDRLELDPKGHRRGRRVEPRDGDPHELLPRPASDPEALVLLYRQALACTHTSEEQALLDLVAQGMNASEACREVGVSRRRWENLQERIKRRLAA